MGKFKINKKRQNLCNLFVNSSIQTYAQSHMWIFWGAGLVGSRNDVFFKGYQAKDDEKRQGEGGGS